MSVWLTIPSKRTPEETKPVFDAWRERGYKIALWCDSLADGKAKRADLQLHADQYPGYTVAVNALIRDVLGYDPHAEWFIAAGDDIYPDPSRTAEEIAAECREHFGGTFGVMQPTGDDWSDSKGRIIERIAGSSWIGRDFATRAYGGNGPLWPEYTHMFEDEELQLVAQKLVVFWQRPDITHFHQHWGRPKPGEKMATADRMPEFLRAVNTPEHWRKSKAIFETRRNADFPGHEPI